MLLKPWSRNVPRYSMAGHELRRSQSQKVARRPEQVGEACEPKIQMRPHLLTGRRPDPQLRKDRCIGVKIDATRPSGPTRYSRRGPLYRYLRLLPKKDQLSHAHFGTFSRSISFVVQRSPFRLLGQPCLLHLLGSSIAHDCLVRDVVCNV